MSQTAARLLATVGGLGDRFPAPGTTVGSLAAAALFAALVLLGRLPARPVAAAGLAALVPLAVWACGAEAARRGIPDPGPVVLDEVAGQWLALSLLAIAGSRALRPHHLVVSKPDAPVEKLIDPLQLVFFGQPAPSRQRTAPTIHRFARRHAEALHRRLAHALDLEASRRHPAQKQKRQARPDPPPTSGRQTAA